MHPSSHTPAGRPAERIELHCLLCGAVAGILEDRRVVRPITTESLRYDGRRLRCGRCGSGLIPGDEVREHEGWRPSPGQRPNPRGA